MLRPQGDVDPQSCGCGNQRRTLRIKSSFSFPRSQVEGLKLREAAASSPARQLAAGATQQLSLRSTPQALVLLARQHGWRCLYAGLHINYIKVGASLRASVLHAGGVLGVQSVVSPPQPCGTKSCTSLPVGTAVRLFCCLRTAAHLAVPPFHGLGTIPRRRRRLCRWCPPPPLDSRSTIT